MSKKHKLLTILLCIVMCMTLAFSLIACDPKTEEKKDETASGKIITNGNFELTSSGEFPKSPNSWKGAAGSTSTDNATETDAKALRSGVINTDKSEYDKNKRQWDKLKNPGKTSVVENDSNVLMIYNKKNNSYRYVSNDFTLESNKFFKISVDVRTDEVEGVGAFVGIGGDTNKLINVGDTKGEWKTVEFFVESSNLESNSVNIVLTNGMKGKTDGKLSKGYAFFDNVIVTESTIEEYTAATVSAFVGKSSMKLSDNTFENISLTGGSPYSPQKWSSVSTTAPTGSDYLDKGILDLNETRPEYVPQDLKPAGADSKLLAINNKQRTSYGYRMDKRVRFESSKYYKLTFNVATYIDSKDLGDNAKPNTDDAGAFIRLKTGSSEDDIIRDGEIKGINTHGTWEQVTFIIKADSKRNKDYYIELGLGTGDKDATTLVTGKVFFDDFTLETISDGDYNDASSVERKSQKVSFDSGNIVNEIDKANSDTTFFVRDELSYKNSGFTYRGEDMVVRDTKDWDEKWGTNPLTPNDTVTNITELKNLQPTSNMYKFDNANRLDITPNGYYRMSLWVKTQDIVKDKGVNISLYAYDQKKHDENNKLPEADYLTKLTSFDNINTANIKNHVTASYNNYVELVFFIEGDLIEGKEVYLQYSLGSGNFLESSKHVKGTCYIADLSFYEVKYNDYNAESGTYIKKHSFKSSTSSVQNGNFDDINKQATIKTYKEKDKDFDLEYDNGVLNNVFGLPTSWTHSDESYLRSSINGGIINNQSSDLLAKLNASLPSDKKITIDEDFYSGFDKEFGDYINLESNRNILAINSKPAGDEYKIEEPTRPEVCGCPCKACADNGFCTGAKCEKDCKCAHHSYTGKVKPWGFTSPSMSLSPDSFYMLSVWAYVVDGEATISLKTNSKDQVKNFRLEADGTSKWQRYDFYVETGFDGTSANLELFLGDKTIDEALYSGTVFFDMPRFVKIDEDIFAQAKKNEPEQDSNIKLASYTVTTFDNITANDDTLDSPVGWTGAHRDEDAPKEDKDTVSGVYNIDHGNRNWFGKDDATRIPSDILGQIYNKDNTNALVINNNVATEYAFTNKLSKTLTQKSFYKFSIDVFTYNVAEGSTANITLKLEGSSYSFSKDADKSINVNTGGTWRTYYFFVQTPETISVDNVSITLGLGNKKKDNYVSGYAFFDNINISKIKEEDFPDEKKPENTLPENEHKYDNSITHRIVFTEDDAKKEEPVENDADPLLWLYITSGIFGGLLIIVVVVVMVKKFYKPKKKIRGAKKGGETYNRNKVDVNKTNAPDKSKTKTSDKFKD